MSTESLLAEKSQESTDRKETCFRDESVREANPSGPHRQVPRVWCAPMTAAGEWVITWTHAPGALFYEVQTSLDATQWNDGGRFSGTRAVLSIGPAQQCWARVRAIGSSGPGVWSESAHGQQEDKYPATA